MPKDIEDCVSSLKDKDGVDNAYALCNWMKNQGHKLPAKAEHADAALASVAAWSAGDGVPGWSGPRDPQAKKILDAENPGREPQKQTKGPSDPGRKPQKGPTSHPDDESYSAVKARYTGTVQLQGPDVKGRILTPGSFTPVVDGEPAEVEFTREVILDAYDRLKARVEAGQVEMRLSHPNVGDLPIKWGKATEVRVDSEAGDVWLTASKPFPEMERLLTDEAREKLPEMGLSINGEMRLKPKRDKDGIPVKGKYVCVHLDIDAIDIVSQGAFAGSDITREVPAGLAAKEANSSPTRSAGDKAGQRWVKAKEVKPMPKITSIDQIPADVRDQLGDDQKAKAYMEAYNAAIEEGRDPVEAAEEAMRSATKQANAEDGSAEDGAAEAYMKKGKAKAAAKSATLEAKLAAKDEELASIRASLKVVEASVATLQAQNAALAAEKAAAEAERDVEWAIVSARRALPAERAPLLEVRKAAGHDKFTAMVKARAQVSIPVGEKGRELAGAGTDAKQEAESKASEILAKFGVEGVFQAGLHEGERAPGIV